jgi:ABC-type bacteriocin/lantibiotic exporter with double-glycine peptidase domain
VLRFKESFGTLQGYRLSVWTRHDPATVCRSKAAQLFNVASQNLFNVLTCALVVQTDDEKAVKVGYTRLLNMNKSEWPLIFIGIIASGAVGTVMPLFALILSTLITSLQDKSKALRFCLFFFGLGAGHFVLAVVQAITFGIVGAQLSERVRQLFFRAVLYMEVGWFDKDENTSGNLTSRLSVDAPSVRGAVADVMGVVVQNVVTLVAGYLIAFLNGWKMTLVITAILPLMAFSSYMQIKFFTGVTGPSFACSLSRQHACFEYWACHFCRLCSNAFVCCMTSDTCLLLC